MEIMNDAEKLIDNKCTFDTLDSFLFREGYMLLLNMNEARQRGMYYNDVFELSNGWVVVGLM